ncbi:MAG: hypothetical protein MUF37_04315 [Methanoregulaceae archaeon]|jgi:hypothetical protein|nr:hypothetical protein [Methanoregulaceae archaeon]
MFKFPCSLAGIVCGGLPRRSSIKMGMRFYTCFIREDEHCKNLIIPRLSHYDSMGLKEAFTEDEWKNLVSLPYAISMAVIAAAPNIMGLWGETKSMMQEPPNLAASSGSALAGLIIAEAQAHLKDLVSEQQHLWKQDQAGYRTKVVAACKSAAAALDKVPPEEALAYKKWVLAVGVKVAEASKEDANAVSDPEKVALGELSAALGVSM